MHTCASFSVCARVRVYRRRNVRARSAGVDRVRFGSQAFSGTTRFSANIGAWNTVSLTTLYYVCAAFGRRRATAAGALGRGLVRRGTCARPHHRCTYAHVYVLAAAGVDVCTPSCAEGRWNAAIYIDIGSFDRLGFYVRTECMSMYHAVSAHTLVAWCRRHGHALHTSNSAAPST